MIQHRDTGDETGVVGFQEFVRFELTPDKPGWIDKPPTGTPLCSSVARGYSCTLADGHGGDHIAHGGPSIVARWRQP